MAKILEVYGSTTGNTESIAHAIEAKLQAAGNDVTVVNAADAQADGLADRYDAVLFGASCWGDEDIEMQEDFAALFENADKMNLKGKKIAAICAAPSVFSGLGFLKNRKATSYPSFMEIIAGDGAQTSEDSVVVDGNITTSRGLGTAVDFALSLISQLENDEKAKEIAESVVYTR